MQIPTGYRVMWSWTTYASRAVSMVWKDQSQTEVGYGVNGRSFKEKEKIILFRCLTVKERRKRKD